MVKTLILCPGKSQNTSFEANLSQPKLRVATEIRTLNDQLEKLLRMRPWGWLGMDGPALTYTQTS